MLRYNADVRRCSYFELGLLPVFLRIAGKIAKIAKIRTGKDFVLHGVNFSAGLHKEENR